MSEIKRIFHERYQKCETAQRPEYNLGKINNPNVYSVDCVFDLPPRKSGDRCDEFIFYDLSPKKTGIYIVERKDNHSNNVKKVKEQLQGGADFIEDFLYKDPATDRQPIDFLPVWVSKGLRPNMRHTLKLIKISLRGIRKPIHHIITKKVLPELI